MLILSPKAVERIESYDPEWPLPKLFRLKKGDKINRAHLRRRDDQHPLDAGDRRLHRRARMGEVDRRPQGDVRTRRCQCQDRATTGSRRRRGCATWCPIRPSGPTPACAWCSRATGTKASRPRTRRPCPRRSPPSSKRWTSATTSTAIAMPRRRLRIWCGGSLEQEDIERLLPWIEWAYDELKAG